MKTILVIKNPETGTRAQIAEDVGQELPHRWERLTQEEFDAWLAEQPPMITPKAPKQIPWAITNADMRRQLAMKGINPDLITDYLKSLPDGAAKWVALADWEYANYFERINPMIETLRPSFGLTVEQVDEMFCAC
jgi:hypothetical protein